MKNVTKILTAVTLCAALFASGDRIGALGGNPALWPGDEANIEAFPGSINDHALVQVTGAGDWWGDWDNDPLTDDTAQEGPQSATILFDKDGTAWGFSYNSGSKDWFNIMWGNGDMGLSIGMISSDNGATTSGGAAQTEEDSGFDLGWGKTFDWGEVGVGYESTSSTASGTSTTPDKTDNTELTFNWRGDVGFWVFDTLTASLESTSHDENGTANDEDEMTIEVIAFTHMDAGGADVLFGMGIENESTSYGNTALGASVSDTGEMLLNSTVAVEANMTDWATFRVGANYSYQLSGENDWTGPGESSSENGWDLSMGLGFNWGGFSADYQIDDGFFNDPISNITGYDDGRLTNQSVTLTYSF